MIAVITADFIDSSSYSQKLLSHILEELKQEFKNIEKDYGKNKAKFKIYRGDSFQGILHQVEESLHVALQIKTAINKLHLENTSSIRAYSKEADLRMAIGIGSFDFERDNIPESNGQAFQFSGRTLDEMKNESRKTRLKTPLAAVNEEFDASLFMLDMLMDKWSMASAEVIYYLLKGLKETEIASVIDISQSAVNQRKKAAGWEAVKVLLERFKKIVTENFKDGS